MLALLYLGLAICVGERLCGRFYRFVSTPHRWATGTLVGLLLSACFTYLAARHFASASNPLIWGDILFFTAAGIFLLNCPARRGPATIGPRVPGSAVWDWLTLGTYCVLACWMMFAVLDIKDGNLLIGITQWSDYGPNTAIVQSFAHGHNFPAEYPHFAGEPIRYHFLFYFLAGNLELLGLNLAWSLNILSVLTLVCMLALVIALGELLFKSRAVGCIASALFFFHGNLNLVPFLRSQTSVKDAFLAIYHLRDYLSSGYPYRGEAWGIWTQVVFVNQRHLASSIGIFLVVLFFLLDQYLEWAKQRKIDRALAAGVGPIPAPTAGKPLVAGGIPARHDDGEQARGPVWTDEVSASAGLSSTEVSQAPDANSAIEGRPSGTGESLEASLQAANYASTGETQIIDTMAYDGPPLPEPETSSVGESQSPGTGESLEASLRAANYASTGETQIIDTVAYDGPALPEPTTSSVGEAQSSDIGESLEASSHAVSFASTGEGETIDTRANDEQAHLTPQTGSVDDAQSPEIGESPEASSQWANYAATSEAHLPETAACGEHDRLETNTPAVSEVQEPEAFELVRQSSQKRESLPGCDLPTSNAFPLVERSREPGAGASVSEAQSPRVSEPVHETYRGMMAQLVRDNLVSGRGFIFSGLLLGALPYWNAPVFTAAAAVLAFLFVLFPCRRYMVGLAITAAVIGLPQVLALRAGNARTGAYLIHWGYTLGNVPISQVLEYIGFTFGVKWVLILVALLFFSWRHVRLFIAICSLFLLTFCFQFSEEALANHKFLNIWLVLANLFVAYGFWRLWQLRIKGWAIPARLVAILLAGPIVIGGIIDFFPLHNASFIYTSFANDRLIKWIQSETKPAAVFLTDKFVNHPILLAGRRIFYGYTYFTWGAGYDLPKREVAYKLMFESKNVQQVFTLLKVNGIDYVAFDAGIRGLFKNSNEEQVYAPNFQKVFEGQDYWQLTIYKVPENADFVPATQSAVADSPAAPGVSAFDGGEGKEHGQFRFPRGLAVDSVGNILIADTNNGRIQKFSPTGAFLNVIGKMGHGPGEFQEPCGIAVDAHDNIYVADVANQRVQKLGPDGTFIAEWKGPEPGFYGPRDVFIGADDSVYVVDQGHARIVKLDSTGKVLVTWGAPGKGDGQFEEATSGAVDDKNGRVYVADPRNKRIEVFDTDGKFIADWPVEEWRPSGWYFQDLVVDSHAGRLYASSIATDEVLVFDLTGKKIASLRPKPPDKLEGASCLALVKGKLYVLNTYASHLSWIDLEAK